MLAMLQPMFQMGFMGSSFATLQKHIGYMMLNVKTYPNHFRFQNMHHVHTKLSPMTGVVQRHPVHAT
jgi:hypothetical protein